MVGIPTALRAAIWLSIPGSGPEGVDPLAKMEVAVKIGDEKGVFFGTRYVCHDGGDRRRLRDDVPRHGLLGHDA